MSELEKISAVKEKSQAIGEFLEWARSEGFFLASWQHFGNPEPEGYDRLVASNKTTNQWLAEYFEIDLNKAEEERQALLDEIRAREALTQSNYGSLDSGSL